MRIVDPLVKPEDDSEKTKQRIIKERKCQDKEHSNPEHLFVSV